MDHQYEEQGDSVNWEDIENESIFAYPEAKLSKQVIDQKVQAMDWTLQSKRPIPRSPSQERLVNLWEWYSFYDQVYKPSL